jgi:hypothetical protein
MIMRLLGAAFIPFYYSTNHSSKTDPQRQMDVHDQIDFSKMTSEEVSADGVFVGAYRCH